MFLFVSGVLSHSNHEISQKGELFTSLIIFEVGIIILGIILMLSPVLRIDLTENQLVIK